MKRYVVSNYEIVVVAKNEDHALQLVGEHLIKVATQQQTELDKIKSGRTEITEIKGPYEPNN